MSQVDVTIPVLLFKFIHVYSAISIARYLANKMAGTPVSIAIISTTPPSTYVVGGHTQMLSVYPGISWLKPARNVA